MPDKVWITDLKKYQIVELSGHVAEAAVRPSRRGSLYLTMTLMDRSGTIRARMWDVCVEDSERLASMRFVTVRGVVDQYNGTLQLVLWEPPRELETPADLTDYLPASPIPLPELKMRLFRHIASIENLNLRSLLSLVFEGDPRIAARFMERPAAKVMHHAFRHGLLQHTVEVADIVAAMVDRQEVWGGHKANRDLALTGALLHDIGKIEEIDDADLRYTYSSEGRLLGHVMLGVVQVARSIARVRRLRDFPRPLEHMILHLISSHHGRGEWGSPTAPMTMEAVLLHNADRLSTELFMVDEACRNATSETPFVRQWKLDGGFGRTGRTILAWDPEAMVAPAGCVMEESPAAGYSVQPHPSLLVLRLVDIREEGEAIEGMRVLPLIGSIAAGAPLLDTENIEGHLLVEASRLSNGKHYLLRVRGDSMSADGIADRDLIVVRCQEYADPGEIVVVRLPDEGATVKRLVQNGDEVLLVSSNPKYSPIPVSDPGRLQVQGKVIGIARR